MIVKRQEVLIVRFEKVKRFANVDIKLPTRATKEAAGYDFEVAEDTVIPPYDLNWQLLIEKGGPDVTTPVTLNEIAGFSKATSAKPTLVSTGMKAYLEPGKYLELSVRSSCPLKHWLILANGVGIIDGDYVDNKNNEGEIFFQLINLSPYPIKLCKGDKIGQGIIKNYYKIDGDESTAAREGGLGSTSK